MSSLKGDYFGNQEAVELTFNMRKKGRMDVNWANLPAELVIQIIENHLDSVGDYMAISSVCNSWHAATLGCDQVILKQKWGRQMPWLMLTDGNEEFSEDALHEFIDCYSDDEVVAIQKDDIEYKEVDDTKRSLLNLRQGSKSSYTINCPLGYGKKCWGSGHGWIAINGLNHDMYIFNPLTNARLDLPSRRTVPFLWNNSSELLRSSFIFKAVVLNLPCDETSHNKTETETETETLLVVLLYNWSFWHGSCVAVAKPGDTCWKGVYMNQKLPEPMDVLYRRDDFGAARLVFVNERSDLAYLNFCDFRYYERPTLRWFGCELKYVIDKFFTDPIDTFVAHRIYLVNSGQDLLMVLRILDLEMNEDDIVRDDDHDINGYKTVDFKVYRFHFADNSWGELQDLLDVALFVGNNATLSVCAADAGCERNCIYFTDDHIQRYSVTSTRLGGHDMGIFRMDDKSFHPLDVGNTNRTSSPYCCPFWFIPTL